MARESGSTKTAVHQIRQAFWLRPRRLETCRPPTRPRSVDKVPCLAHKKQMQALETKAPQPPPPRGIPARRTQDAARRDAAKLVLALNIATGQVTGESHRRHRGGPLFDFLLAIEAKVPEVPVIHRAMVDGGTHKTHPIRPRLGVIPQAAKR